MLDIGKHANKIPKDDDLFEQQIVYFDELKEEVLTGHMKIYKI